MSVEFDTPAARVIKQFSGKDEEQFRIPVNLPDITFLRALSVQGRLRYFTGTAVGANTAITVTPVTGETFFIYQVSASASSGSVRPQIFNDGIQRTDDFITLTGNSIIEINIIDSLVGNGIKTITVTNASTGTMISSLRGWVENTSRIRDVTI